jgi:preprotein translocase subunit SecD
MLYFTRWKALAIILTTIVAWFFAVPVFFPQVRGAVWPGWARRLALEMDPRGASSLLLEVDSDYVKKTMLEQIRDDVRYALRDAKIAYRGLAAKPDSVEVRIADETKLGTALAKLRELSQSLGTRYPMPAAGWSLSRCRSRQRPSACVRRSSGPSKLSSAAPTSSGSPRL